MSNAVPQKKTFFQIANKNFIYKISHFRICSGCG